MQRNSLIYVSGRAANLLLAPLALVLLPGILGEQAYGRYGYWFSLISVYMVLLDLGAQPMLRRHLPELGEHQPKQARTLFLFTQRLKLLPLALLLASLIFTDNPTTGFWLIVAALCAALTTSLGDTLYAFQYMGRHVFLLLGRRILRLILVPILFLIWGIPGILAALVITEFVTLILGLPALKAFPPRGAALTRPYSWYYSSGLTIFLAFMISTLIGRAPVIQAQWAGMSVAELGRLALIIDLSYFALKELINAIGESILPRMIVHHTRGDTVRLHQLIATNYRLTNIVLHGVLALGIGLSPAFLPLLGDNFHLAASSLQVLMGGLVFACWNHIQNLHLMTHNRNQLILLNQIAGLATFEILFMILRTDGLNIHELSIALAGAMFATSVVGLLSTLHYRMDNGLWMRFMRMLPGTALTAWLLLQWQPRGLLSVGMALLAGLFAHTLNVWLVHGISNEDRKLLRSFLHMEKT